MRSSEETGSSFEMPHFVAKDNGLLNGGQCFDHVGTPLFGNLLGLRVWALAPQYHVQRVMPDTSQSASFLGPFASKQPSPLVAT